MVKSEQMHSRYVARWHKTLVCAGSVFVTIGVGLLLAWPWILNFAISQGMAIKPDTFGYKVWQKNPMPLYLDFYMFNWTNPQDIHNVSVKPSFVEIGPIRFVETKEKVNVTFNANGTVSFRHRKTWVFDRKNSVVGLDEKITTLNPITASAVYTGRHWNFLMKKGFQFTLSQLAPVLHVTKSVGELLFYGYEDVYVTLGSYLPPPEGAPVMDKFGWFYTRNKSETAEGHFNMATTLEHFGELTAWNFKDRSAAYSGECAEFHGSAGELYPPYQERTNISFFSSDVCRMLTLDYANDDQVHGVPGYKYVASDNFLDNGTKVSKNACFFNGESIPYGVLNVSDCKYGSPGFVSLPHFYKADPYYLDMVDGMQPDEKKHDFSIILEPTSGVPLHVAARLQLNLLLQPVQYITLFENVPKVFFPVLWFEQVAEIPDFLACLIKLLLNLPLICQITGYLLVTTGIGMYFYIMCVPITQLMKDQEEPSKNVVLQELRVVDDEKKASIEDDEEAGEKEKFLSQ